MRRSIIFILVLFFSSKLSAQNVELPDRLEGIEVFLLKDKNYVNNESVLFFSKRKQKKFFKKYKDKDLSEIPDSFCTFYFDYKNVEFKDHAFLSKDDIKYYQWKDFTIVLNQSGVDKINKLDKEVYGNPFVIVVNNKPLMGGWFWHGISSQACDRAFIMINDDSDLLKIIAPICGKDPRNNEELMMELKRINK